MYLIEEDLEWEKKWNSAINRLMKDPLCFQNLDDDLKNDIHVSILAIELLPENFNFLIEEFKSNKQFIFLVIEKNPEIFSCIEYKKQNDPKLIEELCLINPEIILHLLPSFFHKEKLNSLINVFKQNNILSENYMTHLKKRESDFKDCNMRDFAW